MEYSYKVNMKRKLKYFLAFALALGSLFAINLSQVLKPTGRNTFDILVLVFLSIAGFFILFGFLFLKNRIVINENGIFIFSLIGKRPSQSYKWSTITEIEKGYSLGLSSLLFKEAIILKSESNISYSIPIEWFINYNDILDKIKENNYVENISVRDEFKDEDISIIESFKKSLNEVKNNIGTYFAFSSIIFIFTFLNHTFKESSVSFLVGIASTYFGMKAMIAMNIFAFESHKKNNLTFNEAWERTKGRFWRYYGAAIVQGFIPIISFLLGIYIYFAKISIYAKIIGIGLLGIIFLAAIASLYLITYLSSIINKEKSYFSYNINILKKSYKKIISIAVLENIELFVLCYFILINHADGFKMNLIIKDSSIIFLFIGFLIKPIISIFTMGILSNASYFEIEKEDDNEKII